MSKLRPEMISTRKLKRLLVAIVAGFSMPMIVWAVLSQYVQTFSRIGAGSDAMLSAAIGQRMKPVAHIAMRAGQMKASAHTANIALQAASEAHMEEARVRAALAPIRKTAVRKSEGTSVDAEHVGKVLYEQICQSCHARGLMGAPKWGDRTTWAPRLKEPIETIYRYALKGKGNMPPKGGSSAPNTDVKAAVDYMLKGMK